MRLCQLLRLGVPPAALEEHPVDAASVGRRPLYVRDALGQDLKVKPDLVDGQLVSPRKVLQEKQGTAKSKLRAMRRNVTRDH